MAIEIDKYVYVVHCPDEGLYYISYRGRGFWHYSEQYWRTDREAIEAYRAGIVRFGLVTESSS